MTELPAQPRLLTPAEEALLNRDPVDSGGPYDVHALFEAERERLFRFLWRLSGHCDEAEDLLQETFLTAWRKKARFEACESAAAYLRRTAFHVYLNTRRRRRKNVGPPDEGDLTMDSAAHTAAESEAREQLRTRVREAVAALPDGTREVFVLFRFEGLSCAEIARLSDLSLSAVEGRIERATKLVAVRLRPHWEDMPEL